jgi:hypothetical protein
MRTWNSHKDPERLSANISNEFNYDYNMTVLNGEQQWQQWYVDNVFCDKFVTRHDVICDSKNSFDSKVDYLSLNDWSSVPRLKETQDIFKWAS